MTNTTADRLSNKKIIFSQMHNAIRDNRCDEFLSFKSSHSLYFASYISSKKQLNEAFDCLTTRHCMSAIEVLMKEILDKKTLEMLDIPKFLYSSISVMNFGDQESDTTFFKYWLNFANINDKKRYQDVVFFALCFNNSIVLDLAMDKFNFDLSQILRSKECFSIIGLARQALEHAMDRYGYMPSSTTIGFLTKKYNEMQPSDRNRESFKNFIELCQVKKEKAKLNQKIMMPKKNNLKHKI